MAKFLPAQLVTTPLLLLPFLEPAAEWLLRPIAGNPALELVVVMVLTPLVLDIVVFWVRRGPFVHRPTQCGVAEPGVFEGSLRGALGAPQIMDQVLKHSQPGEAPRRRWSTIVGEDDEEADSLMLNDVYGIDETL